MTSQLLANSWGLGQSGYMTVWLLVLAEQGCRVLVLQPGGIQLVALVAGNSAVADCTVALVKSAVSAINNTLNFKRDLKG